MTNIPVSSVVTDMSQAMSVKFNMKVYDLQRAGHNPIVLSLGEAFFDMTPMDLDGIDIVKGYHYSSSKGLPELREIISNYYSDIYGVNSDPDTEVIISAGSKVLIYMCVLAAINPGDEVIILEPAWVSYIDQVKIAHGTPVMVPYYHGVDDLERHITDKTKLLIVNNPNNPSGKIYTREELDKLFFLAKKYNFRIISDEAYSDFVTDTEPFVSLGAVDVHKTHSFIVNSLSKNLGMSGWRIGYVISNPDLIYLILKLNQHLITCPTTLIELYLVKHFNKIISNTTPQIKQVILKRQAVANLMDEIGLKYLPGSGTFYFCVSIEGSRLKSEEFAMKLLEEHHVCTVPGRGYGDSLDCFLRVSIGTESIDRIKKGLLAIRNLINETK